MSESNNIVLTTQDIAGWEREAAELERSIAGQQQRLNTIKRKLEAVAILRDGGSQPPSTPPTPPAAPFTLSGGASESNETMMDAVVRIAKAHGRPIPKPELKEELRRAGFQSERLGNYFYTVIARLKERQKISVNSNGSVSAPPNLFD